MAAPVFAADSPVTGTWQTEADTPAGKIPATFTFTQTEGVEVKVTGKRL